MRTKNLGLVKKGYGYAIFKTETTLQNDKKVRGYRVQVRYKNHLYKWNAITLRSALNFAKSFRSKRG